MPSRQNSLKDKVLFITGASRGIGKAIALRAARDGAKVVVAAKSTREHAILGGTIYSAAEEIEAAGGTALACKVDVRSEESVEEAVATAVDTFGGIDILVNNASAIFLAGTTDTPMKRFDLMHQVNVRGTYLCSQKCIPHLTQAENPHILNLAPPLNLDDRWFEHHVAYTMSKYGMSMCVLGMARELREAGIAVNALWPKTTIATAAVRNLLGGEKTVRHSRHPAIVADAAHAIFLRTAKEFTGQFCLDEEVLREANVVDFAPYAVDPGVPLLPDFFLDEAPDFDPRSLK